MAFTWTKTKISTPPFYSAYSNHMEVLHSIKIHFKLGKHRPEKSLIDVTKLLEMKNLLSLRFQNCRYVFMPNPALGLRNFLNKERQILTGEVIIWLQIFSTMLNRAVLPKWPHLQNKSPSQEVKSWGTLASLLANKCVKGKQESTSTP